MSCFRLLYSRILHSGECHDCHGRLLARAPGYSHHLCDNLVTGRTNVNEDPLRSTLRDLVCVQHS